MVYEKLLAAAGGGIDFIEETYGAKKCAVLNIGLGGMGVDCLSQVKKRMGEGSVDEGRVIRYLAVDTDISCLGEFAGDNGATMNDQCLHIGMEGVVPPAQNPVIASRFPWYDNDFPVNDMNNGAACIRQVGRLALYNRLSEVTNRIRYNLEIIASSSVQYMPVRINVFSGTGGGTGSGALIDLCYAVRSAMKRMPGVSFKLCAYLLMPDIMLGGGVMEALPQVCTQIKANSYALFKELDHCMKGSEDDPVWTLDDAVMRESFREPPVDVCYPVCATDVDGRSYDGDLYSVVADHALYSAYKGAYPTDDEKGYVVIGSAGEGIDRKNIYNFLAAEAYCRFSDIEYKPYKGQFAQELVRHLRLDFDSLVRDLAGKQSAEIPHPEHFNWRDHRDMVPDYTVPAPIDSYYNGYLIQMQNELSANSYIMGMDHQCSPEDEPSVMRRIYDALRQFACDPHRGPVFAAQCISSGDPASEDIRAYMTYNLERTKLHIKECNATIDLYKHEIPRRKAEFLNAGLFSNRASLFADFLEAARAYYSERRKLMLLEALGRLLEDIAAKLDELYEKQLKPCAQCLLTLKNTFDENAASLARPADPTKLGWFTYFYIKPHLSDLAEKRCNETALSALYKRLFELGEDRILSEYRVASLVSHFTVGLFEEYKHLTTVDYVQKKHYTGDSIIIRGEYNRLLDKLDGVSVPRFWVHSLDPRGENDTVRILIPYGDSVAKSAVGNFMGRFAGDVRGDEMGTQEFLMIKTLSSYCLRNYAMMEELYEAYSSANRRGLHLRAELSELPELI